MATYDAQLENCLQTLEKGDYDHCLQLAEELQANYPDAAEAFHVEAMAHQFRFNWKESIQALDRAIDNAPYDAALYNLTEAIELEDLEAAHRNRVLLYILQEKFDEAAQYLYDRLVANPDEVDNWIMMGDLMKRVGLEEKAETYFEEARRRDPNHPVFA
jgi:tetratricopeptide (TPR) repeat protein